MRDKDYSSSNIEHFKQEGLIIGDLDSLQLTPQGFALLNQKRQKENTQALRETIDAFKESTEKQNEEMVRLSRYMVWLTTFVGVLTLTNIGIQLFEIFYL